MAIPVISNFIQWVIIPAVIFSLFVFSFRVTTTITESELKISSRAGFWAGLLLFVIYVIGQLNAIRKPVLEYSPLPGFLWLPMGFGSILGFAILWLIKIVLPTRLVGLITLLLCSVSTSALFTYIFLDSLRVWVLYLTLGTSLGILLHIVFFPASVKGIFATPAK